MDKKEIDATLLQAKAFLNAYGPGKEKASDEVLAKAKTFLKENQGGPDREEWIGLGGKKVYFPKGTHAEYKPGKTNYISTLGALKWDNVNRAAGKRPNR